MLDQPKIRPDLIPTAKDLLKRGMWPQAEVLYRHIVSRNRGHAEPFDELGIVLGSQGKLADAVQFARKAVALESERTAFRMNLVKHLFDKGQFADAKAECLAVLKLEPDNAQALNALKLLEQQPQDLALEPAGGATSDTIAEQAHGRSMSVPYRGKLAKKRKPPASLRKVKEASQFLAAAFKLFEERDYPAVIQELRALEEAHPRHPVAALWTALCHFRLDNLGQSLVWAQEAATLAPDDHAAQMAVGLALQAQLKFEDAEAAFRAGLQMAPKRTDFHSALAFQKLLTGNWKEGWELFDKVNQAFTRQRLGDAKPWDGEWLKQERLHIWALEGIGDFLMMVRLLAEVEQRAKHVTIECDERLIPLLSRSVTSANLVARRPNSRTGTLPVLGDVQSSDRAVIRQLAPQLGFGSLGSGYLKADVWRTHDLRRAYQKRFPGKRLIGISWYTTSASQGGPRSIRPSLLKPLLSQDRCQFIDLQYRDPDRPMEDYQLGPERVFQDEEIDARTDLDGLAAQTSAMDLVISIDNTTAQLAGALGVHCWTLLHQLPDWRWGLNGEACGWYPTMRLFRQHEQGDWATVVDKVKRDLEAFCGVTQERRLA